MKSYNISDDKVKIVLTDDEVEMLFGSFEMIDYKSPRSRAILDSLICSALPEKMLPLNCEKVLIEVSPEECGCSIQVTRVYDKGRHAADNKRREYILLFNGSEDMIDYIKGLKLCDIADIDKNRLYRYKNRFALFVSVYETGGLMKPAKEYCKIITAQSKLGSAVLEYGKPLYYGAVEKIYKAFVIKEKTSQPG